MNPMRTEAIKGFLVHNTYEDLSSLYNFNMEVQVNVAQDGGTRIDKTFKGRSYMAWTDGFEEWKPIRIPRNAATSPTYEDSPMSFDLGRHAEGIGMTGWDWKNRVSKYVAFDFDAITGHSDKHTRKSSDDELRQIEQLLRNIPWVTLRHSTSGKGLHLYVFLEDISTDNHHEHAALARSILGQLSALVGYDFGSKVDVCGGNMWVWHRKMRNTNGLCLIKQGSIFTDVPSNWRDHLTVVRGDRRRILPAAVSPGSEEELFEILTSKDVRIELDKEHRTLLEYLNNTGATWWWDNDRNMLVTHTFFLARAHEELGLRGVFKTLATGSERGTDHNCFCFPMRRGSWGVRRFTPGVAEDPSWFQDGAGWTKCYLNRDPDLATTARFHDGKERPTGGFQFNDAESAAKTAIELGADVDIPAHLRNRKASVKQHKDGRRLVLEVERSSEDSNDGMRDWIAEKGKWQKVFNVKFSSPAEPEVGDFDDTVRHVVSQDHKDAGWLIASGNTWTEEPIGHVKLALLSQGHKPTDANLVLGSAITKNWVLCNIPFGPEYPGGRSWNRNAAQLRFRPTTDKDSLEYPTWLKMLNHLGKGLDADIQNHPWCINNGITTGGDYLKCWIASMFQRPLEQLPYLFFYSEQQNTGKSSFHEALTLLMTNGAVVEAATALLSESSFNGELASAILCVVEELDLSKGKGKANAYAKIKSWVTAKTFQVHIKNMTPYSIPNSTHWVQMANDPRACPVFPGDTRIVSINVEPLDPTEIIPKTNLLELLTKESCDFLAAILSLEIPPSNDRLNVPVIRTELKEQAERRNQTFMEAFISEEMHLVDGEMILFKDFCTLFRNWVSMMSDEDFTSHRIRDELPSSVGYGASHKNNQRYVVNISQTPRSEMTPIKQRYTIKEGKIFQGGVKA